MVSPTPLEEQWGGHQLEGITLAAVEQEEQEVRVLLHKEPVGIVD